MIQMANIPANEGTVISAIRSQVMVVIACASTFWSKPTALRITPLKNNAIDIPSLTIHQ